MGRRKSDRFYTIGELLPEAMRKLGIKNDLTAYRAVVDWPVIVGEEIARHTTVQRVDGKVLLVAVDSPTWMTQLLFLKAHLLAKIAQHIGAGFLTDIRFVLKKRPFSA